MKYIIYLAAVILLTMFMVYIGIMKEKTLSIELTNRLYRKCAQRVLKFLKVHEHATILDIQDCIKGVQASVIWSKQRFEVSNPVQFAGYVVDNLYKKGKIQIDYKGSTKIYTLK